MAFCNNFRSCVDENAIISSQLNSKFQHKILEQNSYPLNCPFGMLFLYMLCGIVHDKPGIRTN